MKTERWQKIEEIFHVAIAQTPTQRADYLNQACSEDLTLRQEIESLIAFSDEAQDAGFLKNAAITRQAPVWSLEALLGQIVDEKYRIEKQLGQGGMGAVYLATHLGTGRTVAIKIIAPQYMGHSEFVERFKREAEATGRLRHPNVINVTDFGFSSVGKDKLAYLVMEYLNGKTLGDLLKEKGKLDLELVVDIVEQICLAVEEAHKIGIIHRDLKPENIWLEPNGRGSYNVKVLDFGLAKLRDVPNNFQNFQLPLLERLKLIEETPNEVSLMSILKENKFSDEAVTLRQNNLKTDSTAQVTHGNIDPKTVPVWLTRGGMILGTPLYMSPEQCHGKALDNRSDVYSIGVMTYQMLAGETPFTGDFHQLIDKHTNMPVPVIKENPKRVPELVSNCVMTALAKNPMDRPKSMIAFATALKATAQTEISLIRQTISIYSNNFIRFSLISALAYLPFIILLKLGFLSIVLPIWKILPGDSIIWFVLCLSLSVSAFYFTNVVTGVLTIPAVLRVLKLGSDKLSLRSIFSSFTPQWPILLGVIAKMLAIFIPLPISLLLFQIGVNSSGLLSIILISSFLLITITYLVWFYKTFFYTPSKVPNISSQALHKPTAGPIYLTLNVVFIDLLILSSSLVWVGYKVLANKPSDMDIFMVILAGIVGFYAITLLSAIIAPLLSIGSALLYLKAHQSTGETLDEIFEKYQKSTNSTALASN